MNKEQGEERLRLLFIRSVLFDVVEPLATDATGSSLDASLDASVVCQDLMRSH
jgi:hypothetical protein